MGRRRTRVGLVLAVTASLASAAPASAAPEWNYGLPEEIQEQTCASIGAGGLIGYVEELGTSTRAGMLVDPQDIPNVGEVFYGAS